jgi:hypothetical protein
LVCGLGACAESANLGMVCEEPAPALYVKRSSEPAHLSVSTPLLCSRRFGDVVRGWVMTGTNGRSGALPGCDLKRHALISGVADGGTVESLRLGYVQLRQQLTAALSNAISKGWLVQVWDGQGGNVVW